jgi:peroxiredoxin
MKRISFLITAIFAITAFVSLANVSAKDNFAIGATLDNFKLSDVNGKEQSFNDLKGKNGAIIVFLSVQCPVVKGYNERISKLADDYKAKGINVIGINSNSTETLDKVKLHAAENYRFPVLIDKNNVLADRFGANVTPEMFYFNGKNVLTYHGAIDNDRSGKNVTTEYLRIALDESLSGKAVTKSTANAFGCSIKRAEKN